MDEEKWVDGLPPVPHDFLDHFGLADLGDLPGLDDLKASGLLRKGQVIGGLIDRVDDDDVLDSDTDLLEDALMEAGLDADLDDDSGRQGVEDSNA